MLHRIATIHVFWKIALVALLAALYGRMFLFLYPFMPNGGAPFAVLTAIVAGWLFGVRGGFIVSVLLGLENLFLYSYFIDLPWSAFLHHGNFSGMIALLIIGAAVGHMSNLSQKVKAYTELLQYEAFHDPLTQLPNRALFYDRLEHAMARVSRSTTSMALLFLDLDGFKQVNDRYGHLTGDKLLAAFADRLGQTLRLGDTFARIAGDEFVILLEDVSNPTVAESAAQRLEAQLRQPFVIGETEIAISASIGISIYAAGLHGAEDLLREADRAMYQAKNSGKARHHVFQPDQPQTAKPAISQIMAMGD